MRKNSTLLIILVLFIAVQTGFSQNSPIKLGLQVSPNISWMVPKTSDYKSDGISGGVTIGLISDFYFTERYAFSTGLNFSFLNGKVKFPDYLIVKNNLVTVHDTGQTSRKYNFIYLDIPMTIKMSTKQFGKFSLYGQIGFSTGFRLSAMTKDNFVSDKTKISVSDKSDAVGNTSLIRESVIIGFGTEYHLDESSGIILGLAYNNALNNVLLNGVNKLSGDNEKALMNFVELKIGFIF
jgi:hypothetical protein